MNYRNIEKCTWYNVMTWWYPYVVFDVQSQQKGHAYDTDELNIVLGHEIFRWLWLVWLSHILKQAHHEHFEFLCCVKVGIIVQKNIHMTLVLFSVDKDLWLSAVYILYVYKVHFDKYHLASTVITVIWPNTLYADVAKKNLKHLMIDMWIDMWMQHVLFSNALQHSENCNFNYFTFHLLLLCLQVIDT